MTQNQSTNWRELCNEILELLDYYIPQDDRVTCWDSWRERARSALAQPERKELPADYIDSGHSGEDREILAAFYEACLAEGGTTDEVHLRGLHAVLARWGRPAPVLAGEVVELVAWLRERGKAIEQCSFPILANNFIQAADLIEQRQAAPVPVAVSERPWEREGWCHPQERWAWFFNRRVGWRDAIPPESLKPPTLFPYTYSVPYDALPLPSGEVG